MAYNYALAFSIDHSKCGTADSTNFPVGIIGTYPTLATVANGGRVCNTVTSNGQTIPADLQFFADPLCRVPLPFEVASYTASTGAIEAWVQVPTLSKTADTAIYAAYGDKSVVADLSGFGSGTKPWDSNFKAVYHLPDGTTLGVKDSTALHDMVVNGSVPAATGQIDGGASFSNNSANFLESVDSTDYSPTQVTISAWFKTTSSAANQAIIDRDNESGTGRQFQLRMAVGAVNGILFYTDSTLDGITSTGTSYNDGNWHLAHLTYDVVNVRLYVDGASAATAIPRTKTYQSGTGCKLEIGRHNGAAGRIPFNGTIDEPRYAATARSADWITAEYNNQNSPSTFYRASSEIRIAYPGAIYDTLLATSQPARPVAPRIF